MLWTVILTYINDNVVNFITYFLVIAQKINHMNAPVEDKHHYVH